MVSQVKLIAEPWDLGEGGYQVGNFPPLWTEWNREYRDAVRDLWRGKGVLPAVLSARLTGSADLYQEDGRRPLASVNFVTCHEGLPLHDLVSYGCRHDSADGETDHGHQADNRSWNCGVEGETDDPGVLELRSRQMRNFIATLLLSQGVPMISHGDEFARSQRGIDDVSCQDGELSWVQWPEEGSELFEFVRAMVRLRRDHPVFRRRRYLHGLPMEGADDGLSDIGWFTPEGLEMTARGWGSTRLRALTVFLNGSAISEPDRRGERVRDDSFLLMFNASPSALDFVVPPGHGTQWRAVVDTAHADGICPSAGPEMQSGGWLRRVDHSLLVLMRPKRPAGHRRYAATRRP